MNTGMYAKCVSNKVNCEFEENRCIFTTIYKKGRHVKMFITTAVMQQFRELLSLTKFNMVADTIDLTHKGQRSYRTSDPVCCFKACYVLVCVCVCVCAYVCVQGAC